MLNDSNRSDGLSVSNNTPPFRQNLRLLDQVRNVIRCKHYSIRTEHSYVEWIKRYIYFHDKQHPGSLGERHISAFLTHLAVQRKKAKKIA